MFKYEILIPMLFFAEKQVVSGDKLREYFTYEALHKLRNDGYCRIIREQ